MQSQSSPSNSSIKEFLRLTVFTLLCFLALTYNLSEVPPYHTDENFYVTSTRNMVASGDYITPVYHEKKRFAKPILFYWMVAVSYKIFGVDLFSARLVSSFFASLCIPIVYILARRLFNCNVAIISALLLPGCYLHFQIARWAITDMAFNFFILTTFYFFIRGFQDLSNKKIFYYSSYICMGIGFMIKGPIAIIIPALVIGTFLISTRNWQELAQLQMRYGFVILALIILPWFFTMLSIHGDEFKSHILGAELHDRIVHDTPFSLYYFGVIFRYYLPWSFFFLAALTVKFGPAFKTLLSSRQTHSNLLVSKKFKFWYSNIKLKDNQSFLFSFIWVTWPLILFTLFRIEHSRYMLPATVPIVMITANFLSQLIQSPENFQKKIFKVPFYLSLVFYILIITLSWAGIFFFLPFTQPPLGFLILLVISVFVLFFLILSYKSKKYFQTIITLSIMQIIILTSLSGNSLSFFNQYPMKKFSNLILSETYNGKSIGIYQLGNHRARVGVMTGLPSIYLSNPEELKRFIETRNYAYIIMRQSDWEKNFRSLPLSITATDFGWKKESISKRDVELLLRDGLKYHAQKYSESYVLLKTNSYD